MTAVSAPRPGWELLAGQVNQRRYEALRAYLYEGASLAQAACRAGYTRAAGLSILPEKTALADYSYRLSHDHQRAFLAALDQKMIARGLGCSGAPIWDPQLGAVVGMVKSIARRDPGQRRGTAIGVPAEIIRDLCPELRLPARCPYRGVEPFTEEHVNPQRDGLSRP